MLTARILVLNYNASSLLLETLPGILKAASQSRYSCKVSVIDNESTDDSVALIRAYFPLIDIIPRPNRILCSYNDVLPLVSEDIVILLNNDIRVDPGFVDPLVVPFEKAEDVFLVAPKNMDYEGKKVSAGYSRPWFSFGLFKCANFMEEVEGLPGPMASFAAGSAGAYDRKKFLELGGYDPIYLPGTVEDMDLCYNAWKKGYRCLYEPQSVVYHKGQMSFHRRYGRQETSAMNARNVYFFMWKNIDDPWLRLEHALFLLPRFAWSALRGQPYWVSGFFKAFARRREVAASRRCRFRRVDIRTDRQILSLFKPRKAGA